MKVQLRCDGCGHEFLRKKSEADRNKRAGMRTFCSTKCRGIKMSSELSTADSIHQMLPPIKSTDDCSPFRPHMKSIRSHAKKTSRSVTIDAEWLRDKWNEQGGICPLTGWLMTNYKSTRDSPERTPQRASVDRIDSSGEYSKENLRFVCMMAQFAKNNFSEQQLIEFCLAVSNNIGDK